MDSHNILISGAGQLGSRYLQGLARSSLPLKIWLQDPRQESLDRAIECWNEVNGARNGHSISCISGLTALPEQIDVAIVATTADVRAKVVRDIAGHSTVRYWVLEKVLAQSCDGIDRIIQMTASASHAWVNTPRRLMSWHRKMKADLGMEGPLELTVTGGQWGLACNAVHYLDLLSWWTDETLLHIDTSNLDGDWHESKRAGFLEVTGAIDARFSGGSRARLVCRGEQPGTLLQLNGKGPGWQINESTGSAMRSDGVEIRGRLEYQSELSGPLVESILERGSCDLPPLKESAELHRVFVRGMLDDWRSRNNPDATFVPIT